MPASTALPSLLAVHRLKRHLLIAVRYPLNLVLEPRFARLAAENLLLFLRALVLEVVLAERDDELERDGEEKGDEVGLFDDERERVEEAAEGVVRSGVGEEVGCVEGPSSATLLDLNASLHKERTTHRTSQAW